MDMLVTELRTSSYVSSAVILYDRVITLSSPRLVSPRLSLPCIKFPLRGLSVWSGDSQPVPVYRAMKSALGNVEIKTAEDISSLKNLVFVHLWFKYLLDPALPSEDLTMDDNAEPLTPVIGMAGMAISMSRLPFRHIPHPLHTTSLPEYYGFSRVADSRSARYCSFLYPTMNTNVSHLIILSSREDTDTRCLVVAVCFLWEFVYLCFRTLAPTIADLTAAYSCILRCFLVAYIIPFVSTLYHSSLCCNSAAGQLQQRIGCGGKLST